MDSAEKVYATQNNSIRAKLAQQASAIDEAEYVKNDDQLSTNIKSLTQLIEKPLDQTHVLEISELLIQSEETRSLNFLMIDCVADEVTDSEYDNAIDHGKNKWVEAGLRMLSVYNKLSTLECVTDEMKWNVFVKSATFTLISPILELKKTKVLYFLNQISKKFTNTKDHILVRVLSKIGDLKIIDFQLYSEYLAFIVSEIHQQHPPGLLTFLNILPQNIIQRHLFQSIFEYNVFAASSVYSTITLNNLFNRNFGFDEATVSTTRILALLTNMIISGRLHAKINLKDNILFFDLEDWDHHEHANTVIINWQKWYMNEVLGKVGSISDEISQL
ncbi:hypothetical protein DASC09_018010 [Saccharomycopsis crataegensis]|uniref:PCI domain-containing protein n=1 Tax=Saccharomycopsis crataegensis TaxID=43959 RepID=A0AAV5QIG8_9ASCO|nr:hypothetical protein DASC09_018010 [Saccharomycopsis crataegensis]